MGHIDTPFQRLFIVLYHNKSKILLSKRHATNLTLMLQRYQIQHLMIYYRLLMNKTQTNQTTK